MEKIEWTQHWNRLENYAERQKETKQDLQVGFQPFECELLSLLRLQVKVSSGATFEEEQSSFIQANSQACAGHSFWQTFGWEAKRSMELVVGPGGL